MSGPGAAEVPMGLSRGAQRALRQANKAVPLKLSAELKQPGGFDTNHAKATLALKRDRG
jgi:hypothetical protein